MLFAISTTRGIQSQIAAETLFFNLRQRQSHAARRYRRWSLPRRTLATLAAAADASLPAPPSLALKRIHSARSSSRMTSSEIVRKSPKRSATKPQRWSDPAQLLRERPGCLERRLRSRVIRSSPSGPKAGLRPEVVAQAGDHVS